MVHGLFINDWNGDGRADVAHHRLHGGVRRTASIATASWTRTEIVKGDPGEWPRGGVSDVAIGRLGGKRFFVTNEPFHGNQVVVYVQTADGAWPRNIIETTINNSHSLVLVDSDGDGTSRDRLGRHARRARHAARHQARRVLLQGRRRRGAEVGPHGARRRHRRQQLRRRRLQRRSQDGPRVHRRRQSVVAEVVREHEEVTGGGQGGDRQVQVGG